MDGAQEQALEPLSTAVATPTWGERFTKGFLSIFDHLRRLTSFSSMDELPNPDIATGRDTKLEATLECLRRRIEAAPMQGRQTPSSTDTDILGRELKIRLAGMAPVLEERILDNGMVQVIEHFPPWRVVPLYKIVNCGDPKIQGHVRVNLPP